VASGSAKLGLPSMTRRLGHVALVVRDYDQALPCYTSR